MSQRDPVTGRYFRDALSAEPAGLGMSSDDDRDGFWDRWAQQDKLERAAEHDSAGDMQRNLDSAKASLTEQRNALLADAGDDSKPQAERDRLTEQADAVGVLLEETTAYWEGQIAGTHDEDGRWIPRSSGATEGQHADEAHMASRREPTDMNALLRRARRGYE